jgi:hypothetical protein
VLQQHLTGTLSAEMIQTFQNSVKGDNLHSNLKFTLAQPALITKFKQDLLIAEIE